MTDIFYLTTLVCIVFLGLALIFTLLRFIKGPTSADRAVALDLMVNFGIGTIALASIVYDKSVFLDIAIVTALISFLGIVAFGYYIEKRLTDD